MNMKNCTTEQWKVNSDEVSTEPSGPWLVVWLLYAELYHLAE